jgi:hypothetical protein
MHNTANKKSKEDNEMITIFFIVLFFIDLGI